MNRHFSDAWYYLRRAGEHAATGLKEELAPVEDRIRERFGLERPPEPSRLEMIQAELLELEQRAEGEGKRAIHDARERLRQYRESAPAE